MEQRGQNGVAPFFAETRQRLLIREAIIRIALEMPLPLQFFEHGLAIIPGTHLVSK
jgi:hypothetical protein